MEKLLGVVEEESKQKVEKRKGRIEERGDRRRRNVGEQQKGGKEVMCVESVNEAAVKREGTKKTRGQGGDTRGAVSRLEEEMKFEDYPIVKEEGERMAEEERM
eukprot:GHVS01029027.1.p3 GENE.GHVS01029027.1~~GHVS01029027.1.p3  ORF type:complete len:103 (+),score=39.61 GHVS01029027.1:1-309(+)